MIRTSSKKFWLLWILFTCIGSSFAFTLAGSFLNQFDDNTLDYYFPFFAPLAVVVTGLFIGFGQWLTLRTRLKGSIFWIPATAIGPLLGLFFGIGVNLMLPDSNTVYNWIDTLIISIVAGIFTGTLQWVSLHSKFIGFYKWILASGLCWGFGMFFYRHIVDTLFMNIDFGFFTAPISGLLIGAIIGIISGGFVEHTLLFSLPEST